MKQVILFSLLSSFLIVLVVLVFAQNEPISTGNESLKEVEKTNTNTNSIETNLAVSNLTPQEVSNLLSLKVLEIKEEYFTNLDYPINRFLEEKEENYNLTNTNIYVELDLTLKQLLEDELKEKREYKKLEKPVVALDIEQVESKIFARGNILFGLSYGTVKKIPELLNPPSSFIRENFNVNQDMQIYSTSKIGNKVNVDIEFDQKSAINKFNVSYKEPESDTSVKQPILVITNTNIQTNKVVEKPFVRELTFGQVSFSDTLSKYINYTAVSTSAQGIKFVGKTGNFSIEAIGTLSTSIATKKEFVGTKRVNEITIKDIDYIKRKFFKLPDNSIDINSISLYISTSISGSPDVYIDGIPFRKMVQGSEYIFDNFRNEIELKNSIDRSTYLAVFYTYSNGQSMTISSNIYRGNGSDSKIYLYLFKPDLGYSPYEIKNIYSLGSYDIDLSKSIEIKIYYTSDPNVLAPIQFSQNDYYIDPRKGLLIFNNQTPFLTNLIINFYQLSTRDPTTDDSTYSMKISFFNTVISYQLDFDIVEGSEEVRINGVLIPKDKYTIYYPIGRIFFNDPTLISEGDKVEISYEYKPLFGGSQKISLGAITKYKFSNFFSTKLSGAFWTSQGTGTAPRITSTTPVTGFISSLSGNLDLKEILPKDNKLTWNWNFEYAMSLINPNSFGAAIIEDFENNKKAYIVTKDEDSWYLSSAPTNLGCYQTNRGILYYKDYRQYYANESFTLMPYYWNIPTNQILPYSQKPGPYIVSGGRLNPSDFPNVPQVSLVLDYDFSNGGEWVGVVLPLSSSGLDFSDIEEILISYKLQMDNNMANNYDDNNTNVLNLFLELGQVSEDLDGDGIMEYEISTAQDGFDFHLTNQIITKIGGGRKGSGNGRIDSEDLNKNGKLDTQESTVAFSNTISGSDWQKISIKIPSLTSAQMDILKKVYQLRLILKKVNGIKGRILIDEIQIKFRTSSTYKVDGIRVTNPYQIASTTVSVYDSPLYLKNRFFNIEAKTDDEKERLQDFSYLHGTSGMSLSEAKSIDETSLRITYNLSNTSINTNFIPYSGGKEGVSVINFGISQDYSIYSKLIMYIFIPTTNEIGQQIKGPGDTYNDENVVIRFVSKEMNYFEFIIPMDKLKKDYWNRLELRIGENRTIINNDFNNTIYPNIIGIPSWRDINNIELGIKVNDNSTEPINYGEVWFNEFFLTDVKTKFSTAVNSSILFKYDGELLKINNLPIISFPYLTFLIENIFPNFRGNGGKDNINIFNLSHFYSSDFLKYTTLNYSLSLNSENSTYDPTLPDYLFYTNNSRNFRYSISSKHNIDYIPSLSYIFSDRQSTYIQNGIAGTLTNLFLQINNIKEVGLDSTINIGYQIPFITKWINFGNNISLSSSYLGKNYNSTTNNIYYFLSQSYQTWTYSLAISSYLRNDIFNINNQFKHSETFSLISNYPYEDVDYLSERDILQRNLYSLKLLSEGFKERGSRKETYETDTLSITIPNLFKILNVYLTPSYEFKDFNFNESSNTLTRDVQMNGKMTYKFDFNINNFGISSFSLNSSLSTSFSGNSISYETKWYDFYTNNIYRGVAALPFYEYLGFWGYENLSNALVLVSNLSMYRSILSEFTSAGFSLNLIQDDSIISRLIPNTYSFDYSTTTTRELASFRQINKLTFASTWFVPIYKLNWFIFRRDEEASANDLSINLSYSKEEDFNNVTLKNQYNISSLLSGIIKPKQNYSISYTMSYSYQDLLKNLPSFYSNFGIGLSTPNSLQSKVSHNLNFSYNFSIVSNMQIDLIFTKVKVDSTLENKEEINFYTENIWYNNNNFLPFKRKVFELNIYHETSANFSEFVRLGGYLKLLLTQISEIYVDNNIVKETFFEVIPGIEVGINIRVTF
ncbi:MAG: hypothetical protein ACP5PT_04460 [Brevinematia bacterium]